MTFREFLKTNTVLLDGGMGTCLQALGLKPGQKPEEWNISHPDQIVKIHKAYLDAGSQVISTNTFGANSLKFSCEELKKIISAAVDNARAAQAQCSKESFVALDIGPLGRLLKPYGDLDFEEAVEIFSQSVKLGVSCGVDLIFIETMNDSYETKAALLAVKEHTDLPVLVSNAYGEDGKLLTGATAGAMVAMLEGMGVDGLGANCSLGPKQLRPVVEELLKCASVPVLLKPNAGLPQIVEGKTVYNVDPEEFAREVAQMMRMGVRLAGGCCGTSPAYIGALTQAAADIAPCPITPKNETVVSSFTHRVVFSEAPVLIGERINPTGKKRLKEALHQGDMDYILQEGVRQQEQGACLLDVNVGLPQICEKDVLTKAVCALQAVVDLPLQIDTADPEAMEAALRRYNGKAMVNSVSGKASSMEAVFPLVKKYGGVVVALTLDEEGIPETAQGRVAVARKILKTAEAYGISKKDIVFDALALTVSADAGAAVTTLQTLKAIREELGCHTVLGVSNVSFGLPQRDTVNSTFFALALENGLSAAIMNPHSPEMMKTYRAYKALKGMDENCAGYIASCAGQDQAREQKEDAQMDLRQAIIKGFQDTAAARTEQMIANTDPLQIIKEQIIPALNTVGQGFEEKTVYLPQLLMSAEAAKSAFEVIRRAMPGQKQTKGVFLLATVHGDIHDIGKNIVKLLLENYGYGVVDLGKDVPAERIAEKAAEMKADIVGLSALMTTTVGAMEKTISLLREKAPGCKIIVGGAVLTKEYAQKIGADCYGKDAMEAVRFCQKILG